MGKTLMIVDDSMFVYEEMKYMLKDSEFEIVGYARSGEDAITLYEKLKPQLVTMDIILPGIDGLEASAEILKNDPKANIAVVSSLDYDDTTDTANQLGIVHFLFKPFTKEQLIETLTRAIP